MIEVPDCDFGRSRWEGEIPRPLGGSGVVVVVVVEGAAVGFVDGDDGGGVVVASDTSVRECGESGGDGVRPCAGVGCVGRTVAAGAFGCGT